MLVREPRDDLPAQGMTDHVGPLDTDRVEHSFEVSREPTV
jgi:hypothetical protein